MRRFIETNHTRFGVEPICRVLEVAHPPTTPPAADHRRRVISGTSSSFPRVRRVHAEVGLYGARKVWGQLQRKGSLLPAAPSSD